MPQVPVLPPRPLSCHFHSSPGVGVCSVLATPTGEGFPTPFQVDNTANKAKIRVLAAVRE